jgi:hypothetical protein
MPNFSIFFVKLKKKIFFVKLKKKIFFVKLKKKNFFFNLQIDILTQGFEPRTEKVYLNFLIETIFSDNLFPEFLRSTYT